MYYCYTVSCNFFFFYPFDFNFILRSIVPFLKLLRNQNAKNAENLRGSFDFEIELVEITALKL